VTGMSILEVKDLRAKYGSIEALKGISLEIRDGEKCVALVGPNGAGKSTFVNALTGLMKWEGTALVNGESIAGLSNTQLVRKGIVQCPERRYLFDYMSVKDNLLLGTYNARKDGDSAIGLRDVFDLFPVLEERLSQKAGTLSGGEAQMTAIGRSLLANPKLLFLDEPTLGLAPIMRKKLGEAFTKIATTRDVVLCLVEQNVKLSFDVAERVYVIREGHIVKEGVTAALAADPDIHRTFLGV
jgi:branched-chain amino acid transport system ATP-binding protein